MRWGLEAFALQTARMRVHHRLEPSERRRRGRAGLKKSTRTGPETAVTGQTAPDRFGLSRFQIGSNLKFKFEFKNKILLKKS